MTHQYNRSQIEGAKNNANLHGFNRALISDDLAVQFLDWWFSNKKARNCYMPTLQRLFWENHLDTQG